MGNPVLILRPDFPQVHSDQRQEFNRILKIQGEVYRENYGRKTLRFIHSGQSYFLKVHTGVGWKEIFKNLFQFRLPTISARTEWSAISRLQTLGIDTMTPVGFGCHGLNPARKQSFLITEDLGDSITLEDLFSAISRKEPKQPHELRLKRALIRKVAIVARTMHQNGVNHRDFYLCHFRLPLAQVNNQNPQVYVMDLHRAQLRSHTPRRWVVKDLAALYFSALVTGMTRSDLFRFIKIYKNRPLREELSKGRHFWHDVIAKAKKIQNHHQRMLVREQTGAAALATES